MTVGETSPELPGEVDFDYEKFRERLIPEWQKNADRLFATDRGKEILNDSDFRDFVFWNSWEIDQVHQLIMQGHADPGTLSDSETSKLYYMHTSLLGMDTRVESLELITQSAALKAEELEADNPEKALIKKRKLASMLEEMSTITSDDEAAKYALAALDINKEVDKSPLLEVATSPRKVHAQFAQFDIRMRSLTFGPHIELEHAVLSDEALLDQVHALQLEYYKKLSETISTTMELENQDAEGVSGSFGALLVLGRLRDRINSQGRLSEIEASNSFMRQDHAYLGNLTTSWNWSWAFDLNLENHQTGKSVPVEVKKLTQGKRHNGRPNRYLPIIEVVQFKLGTTKEEYLRIAKDYCDGRASELSGDKITSEQAEAIRMFEEIIDPELDRVFARLDNPNEVATNYSKERQPKPKATI